MRASLRQLLLKIEASGYQSHAFDLPLLLRAADEDALDEESSGRLASLLGREMEVYGFRSLGDGAPAAKPWVDPPSPIRIPRGGASLTAAAFDSYYETLLDRQTELGRRFPAAASAFSPWIESVRKEFDEALNTADARDQRGAAMRAVLAVSTMDAEEEWQENFERHFWNGIRIAVLQEVMPPFSNLPLFAHAHARFGRNGADARGELAQSGVEREALHLQLPLLSAELMAQLSAQGIDPAVSQLGFNVRVDVGARRELSLLAPGFGALDRPALMKALDAGHEVVSLPVTSGMIDTREWELLQESRFFLPHPGRLVPSNAFFGMAFDEALPAEEAIREAVLHQLPEHFEPLSAEESAILDRGEPERGIFFAASVERAFSGEVFPKFYRVATSSSEGREGFLMQIRELHQVESGFRPVAELRLGFARGEIREVSYRIYGLQPMSVQLTPDRTTALVERARANFIPVVPAGCALRR